MGPTLADLVRSGLGTKLDLKDDMVSSHGAVR